ncbi:hypothetical protein GOA91_30860 [Sinorhizobium meliloti]|nr:hypothetical protein [Sinorhizobium meliloti]
MLLTLASNGNAGTHVVGAWRDTMHLVVCIEQVPDSAQIRVHPVTNTIMHQGVPTAINPHASRGLHRALAGSSRSQPPGELTCSALSKVPAIATAEFSAPSLQRPKRRSPGVERMTAASIRHCASPCRLYDADCSFNRVVNFRSNSLRESN